MKKTRIKAGKYLMNGTQLVDSGLRDGMTIITNGGVRIAENDPVVIDQVVRDSGGTRQSPVIPGH